MLVTEGSWRGVL